MVAGNRIPVEPEKRHATVLVDYVRTTAAAAVIDTGFHRAEECFPPEQDALQDLEERIRRLAVHHWNDLGIPVSTRRPFTVEATPESAFLIRAGGIILRHLPGAYKGTKGWWHSRQDKVISAHYKTAAVSFDLRRSWDEEVLAAVAGLPILERKILGAYPGINVHIALTWTTASIGEDGAVITEDNGIVVTSGCVQRGAIVKLLKKLDSAKGGSLNDRSLVVLRGRRWQSLFLNRIWVLPMEHGWAAKQNHLAPRNTAMTDEC